MDQVLEAKIYAFLVGREGKADSTVDYYMQRLRRMGENGFDFEAFARDADAAQTEGDRYLVHVRTQNKAKAWKGTKDGREAVRNVKKILLVLKRLYGWQTTNWRIGRSSVHQPNIYTLADLERLLSYPFVRTHRDRFRRALIVAHLALGWRIGELAKLRATDIDAGNKTVFLAFPEKGNPQRRLPVPGPLFSPNRAFMSWVRRRPVVKSQPDAIWTFRDRAGELKVAPPRKLALELSKAARQVGVRANCNRGRHTCLTALLLQKYQLPFVKFWAGHANYATLSSYLEVVDLGLAKHLANPAWFIQAPRKSHQ
jgi:integrase